MGRDVPAITVSQQDRRAYREKVRQCLDVFARMLRESRFETEPRQVGVEIELNLVDDECLPAMTNTKVLEAIADPSWATPATMFTGFAFAGAIYFLGSFGMSRYASFVERRLDIGRLR